MCRRRKLNHPTREEGVIVALCGICTIIGPALSRRETYACGSTLGQQIVKLFVK